MLVKSLKSIDHISHLKQTFDLLREYNMKLNPDKCSFGVRSRKFLGYLVSKRGIKANSSQIKTVMKILSPQSVKDIQKRINIINYFVVM